MVKNYKCPGCGGAMQFDSESQKMHCEHCDTYLTVEELDSLYKGGEEPNTGNYSTHDEYDTTHSNADFQVFKCPSCGAEIITNEHTAATFCSFCGNPGIIKDRVEGAQTPDAIIPFKIGREQAIEIYKAWTKKGLLTPSEFRSQSVIDKITGIYVPFWIYDYGAKADVTAHCTRVHTERRGNTEYVHTDNFLVTRDVQAGYSKIPADASEEMEDDIMDKMEPFNYNEMTAFEMPYLSGYYAEKFNYSKEELAPRVEQRVHDYIVEAACSTIQGYTTTTVTHSDVALQKRDAKYTMFPVWVLNYSYKGKTYNFSLNGQTGKVVGTLPLSKGKFFGFFALFGGIAFAVLTLLGGLLA